MTGLEIAAAVASILGGIFTSAKYAQKLHEKWTARRLRGTDQSGRLSLSLNDSALELSSEWRRMDQFYIQRPLYGSALSSSLLSQTMESVQSLHRLLNSLANQNYPSSSSDLTIHQNLADRSRQLATRLLTDLGARSTSSRTDMMISPFTSSSALLALEPNLQPSSELVVLSRSQINSQGICRNALKYRRTESGSDDLATLTTIGDAVKWTCLECNASMTRAACRLPGAPADMLWIDEAGLFKSHCARESDSSLAWTCIWPISSASCMDTRFDSEKALLQHMKDHHVFISRKVEDFRLQWPADLSVRTAETCGFGARIAGRAVRAENFVFSFD